MSYSSFCGNLLHPPMPWMDYNIEFKCYNNFNSLLTINGNMKEKGYGELMTKDFQVGNCF